MKMRGARKYSPTREGGAGRPRKVIAAVVIVAAVGAFFAAVGFGLHSILSRSDFFQITAIKITGTHKIKKSKIVVLSGINIHSNLLAVDTEAVEKRLADHPWIKNAKVWRDFPNRLLISLDERRPAALVANKDGLSYIDGSGTIYASLQKGDALDFPVITGLTEEDWLSGEPSTALDDALRIIRWAGRGNPNLPRQNISQLHLGGTEELIIFLADRPFPIFLGQGDMAQKYRRLTKVLGWLYKKGEFKETTAIRLEYLDNKVLVEKGGSG